MRHLARLGLLLLLGGFLVSACTSVPPEDLAIPLPTTTVVDDAEPSTTTSTVPEIVDFTGAIAVGGRPGLVVVDGQGFTLRTAPDEPTGLGTQPTWSRDGERVVALVPSGAGAEVVVSTEDETFTAPARRGYFFFSWSGDGQYIAALGPGPLGTTLDILTAEGALATEQSLDTASFYLAWEPFGDDLVVHRDRQLELVRDPLDLETLEPLGEPGQSFLAPAWIPGTREIIIVDEIDDGRLVRLDVDTGASDDLGPVGGEAGLAVSPDGGRLFLTHSGPNVERSDDIQIANRAVQDDLFATEVVLLETGERVMVNDEISLWAEWAPDGDSIAFLQPGDDGGVWRILDEGGVRDLGDARLSGTFFRNYVFFAWQYVESPRIWSPDSDAIVYAAGGGITVHPINGDAELVSDGDVAFWAPELPGGARSPA